MRAPSGAVMPRMRPDAIGLRMKRTQWAALMSPVNRPRPATKAGSSSRRIARPTHFIPEPAVAPVMARHFSKSGGLAEERLANDVCEVGFADHPRVIDLDGRDHVDGLGEVLLAHAETLKTGWQSQPYIEVIKPARRVARAERALDARHGLGRSRAVEADGVGRRDGVGMGVVES